MDEIRQVGVNHFHFSLNWSALVPTGDVAHPNTTLLGYYHCFTRQLLQANVTPVVTLWHHTRQRSSLPAPLDTANRWLNRSGTRRILGVRALLAPAGFTTVDTFRRRKTSSDRGRQEEWSRMKLKNASGGPKGLRSEGLWPSLFS